MLGAEPVRDFMTQAVLSIERHSPAGEVLRHFSEYPVHHLPVVDQSKVVGMLSSADVMKIEMFLPRAGMNSYEYLNRNVSIEKLMRQPAITIRGDQSLESAAHLMAENGVHALPVTDHDDYLIGIITTTDIMHAALHPDAANDSRQARAAAEESHDLTDEQLAEALRLATTTSTAEGERGRLSRALLHMRRRLVQLEHVRACAERYLHAGQDTKLHTELLKALKEAGRQSASESWLV